MVQYSSPADGRPDLGDNAMSALLLDEGGTVFNVKAYGAKGDGSYNDRPAIQLALTTCIAAGGGTVFVPAGTYLLDATPLTITNNFVRFIGAGMNVSILQKTVAGDMLDISECQGVTIEHLQFSGGDAVGWCIDGDHARSTKINKCRFSNSSTAQGCVNLGAVTYGCYGSSVTDCVFGSIKATGLRIAQGSASCYIAGNRIDGDASLAAGGRGVYIGSAKGTTLVGNIIETIEVGIQLEGGGIAIMGGYFETTKRAIIATGAQVTGLSIDGVFFGIPHASSECEIDFSNVVGFTIKGCLSETAHSVAFVRVTNAVQNGEIGPNHYVDTLQVSGTQHNTLQVTDYSVSAGTGVRKISRVSGSMRVVEPKTSGVTLTTADSWKSITNTGAVGSVTTTLPAAAVGLEYYFTVTATQTLVIDPSGSENYRGKAAGKNMSSTTQGDWLRVWCAVAGVWEFQRVGTWTDEA